MYLKSFNRLPLFLRSSVLLAMVALIALGVAAGPRLVDAQEDTSWAIGDSLVVNTDALNLRDDATTDGNVIAILATGDAVSITGDAIVADGYDWYAVSTDSGDGYVAGEYLGTTVTVSTSSGFAVGDAMVVNTDALNLRDDASTSGSVLAVLETGASAVISDSPVSADGYTWYYVSTDAGYGWVAGEYLGYTVTISTSSLGIAIGDTMVVNTDALNLRNNASTSADVLAVLATGDATTVADGPISADGYTWFYVTTASGYGWVAGDYLAATVTISSDLDLSVGSAVYVDTDGLNLRDDATTSGTVLAVLETGASATITDGPVSVDGYTWYYVTSDAGDGWVAGEFLALA